MENETVKYDYLEGFCATSGYKGLYPAAAEQDPSGTYRYTKMACGLVKSGDCKIDPCPILKEYDPVVPEKQVWRLLDKPL